MACATTMMTRRKEEEEEDLARLGGMCSQLDTEGGTAGVGEERRAGV